MPVKGECPGDAAGADRLQGLHPRRHAQGAVPHPPVHPGTAADFKWTEAEKTKFGADFQSQVSTAWSKKHELVTKDPTFAEHRALVEVKVELVKKERAQHDDRAEDPEGQDRVRRSRRGSAPSCPVTADRVPRQPRRHRRRQRRRCGTSRCSSRSAGSPTTARSSRRTSSSAIAGVAATIKRKGFALGERVGSDGKKHDLAALHHRARHRPRAARPATPSWARSGRRRCSITLNSSWDGWPRARR